MIEQNIAQRGSTRHHVTDERFAALLEGDFGISAFAAHSLIGCPKKAAIMVCAWAESNIADADDRSAAVRAWARKRGVGQFDRRLIDAPAETYEQTAHERAVREER